MPSAFKAVNATKIAAKPIQNINPGQANGEVRLAYDEYTSLANLGAGDTIETGIIIPAGAKIKSITVVSPTNGGTMSVGISGSATKYVNAATGGTTTVTQVLADTTVDEQLIITMGAATATGLYKIAAEFVKV